ncbi:hypothetical protein [Pseudomonas cichorii]|uniref:hypothetical protein n=1 Tax=Pseudomonas cichorii TaxID=36746 RepID=UPI001C8A8337|nr:hypothetical protein [Pseudomonas cichorii]MBX8574908.1 hypothetical protein [Pseudomonas cichorii]
MSDTLADLDTLALKCRAERSREYISESIQCYKAGAYRSAIVNVWIAVVFDLVDKIRDLALANDAIAQRINSRYESYIDQINAGNDQGIKNALEFERTIIVICGTQLGFFDHQQMRDLQRLREDRHQCAHPSFQSPGIPHRPTAELARLHLRNAVEHVLSKPPVQGRAAIAELITIIASDYFPKDYHQASIALQHTSLANPSDALIRGLVDSLVFGFANAESPIFGKLQVSAVLSVLLASHRGIAEPRISQQLSTLVRQVGDLGFPAVATMIATLPELAGLVDEAARVRLAEFLRVGPETEVLAALAVGRHSTLTSVVEVRIRGMSVNSLAMGVQEHGLGDLLKSQALVLLSESGSWYTTNDVIEKLLIPIFDTLTADDVRRIIRMPQETGADLIGSNLYDRFINQVDLLGVIPSDELDQLLTDSGAEHTVRRLQRTRAALAPSVGG